MKPTKVALVVTGKLEQRALPQALQRLFPSAAFTAFGPFADSTSQRLVPAKLAAKVPSKLDELIGHLAASLVRKNRETPAHDFAVLIEDMELVNRGNEAGVRRCVQEAVQRHTQRVPTSATALLERASVHLLDPMVETYFYDDVAVLKSLNVASHKRLPMDPERFQVLAADEPDYFAANEGPWASNDRAEHPKKYLAYLLREPPPDALRTTYKETRQGAEALARLDWNSVLGPGHSPFLRALIEDLAEALNVDPQLDEKVWRHPPSLAPTSRAVPSSTRVLRNL